MNSKKLISTRAAHRKVIEGQLNRITADLCSEDIRAILEGVMEKVVLLKQLNEKIVSQTDVADIENEIVESEEYMIDLESRTRKVRREFTHQDGTRKNVTQTESAAGSENIREENNNNTSSQHNVRSEFSYLKSLTQDAAARAIDGFPLTNANYTKAVDLLRDRFGQPHKIIHAYMQALLELPRPSKNIQSLQAFHDNLETYIKGLQSLGQSKESYGSLLVPVVIDKLPPEIRSNMTRSNGSSDWTIDSLREALKSEISILQAGYRTEASDQPSSTVSFHAGTKTGATHPYRKDPKSGTDRRSQEKKCQFCGDKHLANECKKVTTVSARKEIVKQKHLCFNCLGNHLVSSCRSSNRCRTCHKKHHSSICDRQLNQQGQSSLNAAAASFLPASSTESTTYERTNPVSSQNSQSAILHSTAQKRQNVFLKTAIAQISSRQCRNDVNILFDEGSQRSFITENMANKIQLERNGNEEVHIASFEASTQNIRHFDTATVWLHTDIGEKLPINVLVVPTIAVPLCNLQKTVSSLPYLQGLSSHTHQ